MENKNLNVFTDKMDLILKYKETNDQNLFEELVNDKNIKTLLTSFARKKIVACPTTLYDFNDLLSIAYIEMWRAIINYKFICPICKIKTNKQKAYEHHMIRRHKKYLPPKPTIDKHILYNIGVYIQNSIRDEYNIKRMANHVVNQINLFSPRDSVDKTDSPTGLDYSELAIACNTDIQEQTIFKILLDETLKDEDEITKEIFEAYIKGYKNCDIADYLHKKGIYSSQQSASVMVSRKIKELIQKFSKYYLEENS